MQTLKNTVELGHILGFRQNVHMTVPARGVLDDAEQNAILFCLALKGGQVLLLQVKHPQFFPAAKQGVHVGLAPQLLVLVRQCQT